MGAIAVLLLIARATLHVVTPHTYTHMKWNCIFAVWVNAE